MEFVGPVPNNSTTVCSFNSNWIYLQMFLSYIISKLLCTFFWKSAFNLLLTLLNCQLLSLLFNRLHLLLVHSKHAAIYSQSWMPQIILEKGNRTVFTMTVWFTSCYLCHLMTGICHGSFCQKDMFGFNQKSLIWWQLLYFQELPTYDVKMGLIQIYHLSYHLGQWLFFI